MQEFDTTLLQIQATKRVCRIIFSSSLLSLEDNLSSQEDVPALFLFDDELFVTEQLKDTAMSAIIRHLDVSHPSLDKKRITKC